MERLQRPTVPTERPIAVGWRRARRHELEARLQGDGRSREHAEEVHWVDGIALIIVNYGSGFRAIPPICPHMEEPLDESGVIADCTLTCSRHLWVLGPALARQAGETEKLLGTYEVKQEGDDVLAFVDKEIVYEFEDEDDMDDDDFLQAGLTLPPVMPTHERSPSKRNGGEFSFECELTERILYAAFVRYGPDGALRMRHRHLRHRRRGRIMQGAAHGRLGRGVGLRAGSGARRATCLMCQARPTTDCVLRVPAKVAAKPDRPTLPAIAPVASRSVRGLTHDVMDFEFRLSRPMTFEAGQFVVLGSSGVQGGRAYLMVNFGRGIDRPALGRQAEGRRRAFCDWLFRERCSGQQVNVFGPLGRATFHPEEGKNILCIAGGSGIAGMLSILERATRRTISATIQATSSSASARWPTVSTCGELSDHVGRRQTAKLDVTLALSHEQAPGATHPHFPRIRLMEGMVGGRDGAGDGGPLRQHDRLCRRARRPWWTAALRHADPGGAPAAAVRPLRQVLLRRHLRRTIAHFLFPT